MRLLLIPFIIRRFFILILIPAPEARFFLLFIFFINDFLIINHFIFNGRRNAGLSQRDVADALTGGALVLQLTCSEEANALERAETLAKASVKEFPEYLKTAQAIFPEIKFEEATDE